MNRSYVEYPDIRLRSIEMSDIDTLYKWENLEIDWKNNQYYNPISKEFIKNLVLNSSNYLSNNSDIIMVVDSCNDGTIGYVQLMEYDAINRRAAIGVFIDIDHRGKGYAKKALSSIISYAFKRWNIRMLYSKILGNNIISINLFKSLGFNFVASIPEWAWIEDEFVSLNYYQLCNQ